MRILFLTNSLEIGGIERNIVRLTAELSQRGHEVHAATAGGHLVEEFTRSGGRHHRLPAPAEAGFRSRARALRRVVDQHSPSCIHVFSASSAALLRAAFPTRPPAPVVASIMGLQNAPDEPARVTWLRVWVTTWAADRVLLIAPSISRLAHALPVPRSRFREQAVVGVDPPPGRRSAAELEQFRARLGVPADAHIVTTIGNLEPRKSHELFIAAANDLASRHPTARFFVVGGGHLRADLEEMVADDRIRLLGPRDDIDELLQITDVYVKPGIVEGFIGITVLEAQLHAVPVVAFETLDVQLAIDDGRTGMLVEPGDTDALAESIDLLLTDPVLRRRLGETGREHAFNRFALSHVADGLLSTYEELVQGSVGRARR